MARRGDSGRGSERGLGEISYACGVFANQCGLFVSCFLFLPMCPRCLCVCFRKAAFSRCSLSDAGLAESSTLHWPRPNKMQQSVGATGLCSGGTVHSTMAQARVGELAARAQAA